MEKENNIIKKISKIIGTIITIIVVFLASIIIVQKFSNNQMSVLGFRIFVVQTGSMIPKYNIGDVILVKTKSIDSIKVGDDISYLGEERDYDGKVVTHQVVNVDKQDGKYVFTTKGIANKAEDPLVDGDQVYGTVLGRVNILTFLYKLINSNEYILYFIVIVPLTIYIFFGLFHPNGIENKKRKDN